MSAHRRTWLGVFPRAAAGVSCCALLVVLSGCQVNPERHAGSSNAALDIEVVGSVDGCTIYRFFDGRTVHFVRCGQNVTTQDSHMEGKYTMQDDVSTVVRK